MDSEDDLAALVGAVQGRLRALTELYPDGVLGADSTGVVHVLNGQAARLLGVDAEGSVGRQASDVLRLRTTDGVSWLEYNHPFRSIGIRQAVPEQSWINEAGEEVLTTARLIRGVRLGPVLGIAISLRTGRGRARLDQERSDLLASVAHELRSPLSGVKGFVQVMLNRWEQLRDDQKKLMLTTVHSDADRLSRLIAELLDIARLDTGRLSLAPRSCDATVMVGRVVESVRASTSRSVELVAEDDLPDVWADPDKLVQVVTNLVENAVLHGAGTVRVGLEADGTCVLIVVDDEGEGIPPEMRRRVFTKFWTTGVGGSGLGLYLAQGLVAVHGGSTEIGEAPGGGARVRVRWPTRPPD